MHTWRLLPIVAITVASCNYIDPTDIKTAGRSNNTIVVVCDGEEQPQLWHFDIFRYDEADVREYDSEDGRVDIIDDGFGILIYNTDSRKVKIREDAVTKNKIATTDAMSGNLTYNGKPLANMPDMLYSEFVEEAYADNDALIHVTPRPRVFTFDIKIEINDPDNVVYDCLSAVVDGFSKQVDLITLKRSATTVAMAVPMWLTASTQKSAHAKTATGTMTTFGRPSDSQSRVPCHLVVNLVKADNSALSSTIDISDCVGTATRDGNISLSIDIADTTPDNGNGPIDIKDRNKENSHVNL